MNGILEFNDEYFDEEECSYDTSIIDPIQKEFRIIFDQMRSDFIKLGYKPIDYDDNNPTYVIIVNKASRNHRDNIITHVKITLYDAYIKIITTSRMDSFEGLEFRGEISLELINELSKNHSTATSLEVIAACQLISKIDVFFSYADNYFDAVEFIPPVISRILYYKSDHDDYGISRLFDY